jgi:hypothetical protein
MRRLSSRCPACRIAGPRGGRCPSCGHSEGDLAVVEVGGPTGPPRDRSGRNPAHRRALVGVLTFVLGGVAGSVATGAAADGPQTGTVLSASSPAAIGVSYCLECEPGLDTDGLSFRAWLELDQLEDLYLARADLGSCEGTTVVPVAGRGPGQGLRRCRS